MDRDNSLISASKMARHRTILNLLTEKKSIHLRQLEELLHCSRITIQRDLVELENKGLLKRVRGAAILNDYDLSSYDHEKRLLVHSDKKKKIAKKAMSQLDENLFICMDASSTVYFMSEELFPKNVQVVTTGIDTFLNLQRNRGVTAVLAGGRMNAHSNVLVGPETIHVLKQFHFDIGFFSIDAVIPDRGIYDSNNHTAHVTRTIIEQSDRKILLFDTSKIPNRRGAKICDLDIIDLVVTDDPESEPLKTIFWGKIV